MADCVNALKEWTSKTTARAVYDSMVDEFTNECLFQKVRGKPNIAIVATTKDGDVFGGFYSVAVTGPEGSKDPNMFAFSFESHGRCMTPQRFAVKKGMFKAGVRFYQDDFDRRFVWFFGGFGWFYLGNEKSGTSCSNLSAGFEGIENNTLTGTDDGIFTCCRLVAVQLE